jgi:hypothetical protein
MEPALQPILLRKPFSPATLPGLALWLDAANGVLTSVGPDVPAGGGQAVRQWKDRSASAFDTNQTVGGAQPLLLTGWRGSRPALVFDGVDDQLFTLSSPLPVASGDTYTVVMVADYISAAGVVWASASGGSLSSYSGLCYRPGASTSQFVQGDGVGTAIAQVVSDVGAAVRSYRLTASVVEARVNGVSIASTARFADSVDSTGFYIGMAAAIPMSMKLGEVIVYNRALADLEIATLERWLAGRYSL